eukprot:551003_1
MTWSRRTTTHFKQFVLIVSVGAILTFVSVYQITVRNQISSQILLGSNEFEPTYYDNTPKHIRIISIIHVTNALNCMDFPDHPSYLYYAQPYTFLSWLNAKTYAMYQDEDHLPKVHHYRNISFVLNITLTSAHYPKDDAIIPNFITILPHLNRSLKRSRYSQLTNAPELQEHYAQNKTLADIPFIADIIGAAYNHHP